MDYKEIMQDDLRLIVERLERSIPINETLYKRVIDSMRYSLLSGGKRLRAVLTVEFCKLFGGNVDAALDFAAAIEMIHTYSLIHDDLPSMDDDDMRRGKPSNHIAFGEAIALLAGDGLLTQAFNTITCSSATDAQVREAVRILSDCAGFNGMIGGQVIDLRFEGEKISFNDLHTMHSLKTGKLICASIELGAILGNATDEQLEYCRTYGQKLGLAFQIVDDILDFEGDAATLGKPTGSDKDNSKCTFVTLMGLENSKALAAEYTRDAIEAVQKLPFDTTFFEELCNNMLNRKY